MPSTIENIRRSLMQEREARRQEKLNNPMTSKQHSDAQSIPKSEKMIRGEISIPELKRDGKTATPPPTQQKSESEKFDVIKAAVKAVNWSELLDPMKVETKVNAADKSKQTVSSEADESLPKAAFYDKLNKMTCNRTLGVYDVLVFRECDCKKVLTKLDPADCVIMKQECLPVDEFICKYSLHPKNFVPNCQCVLDVTQELLQTNLDRTLILTEGEVREIVANDETGVDVWFYDPDAVVAEQRYWDEFVLMAMNRGTSLAYKKVKVPDSLSGTVSFNNLMSVVTHITNESEITQEMPITEDIDLSDTSDDDDVVDKPKALVLHTVGKDGKRSTLEAPDTVDGNREKYDIDSSTVMKDDSLIPIEANAQPESSDEEDEQVIEDVPVDVVGAEQLPSVEIPTEFTNYAIIPPARFAKYIPPQIMYSLPIQMAKCLVQAAVVHWRRIILDAPIGTVFQVAGHPTEYQSLQMKTLDLWYQEGLITPQDFRVALYAGLIDGGIFCDEDIAILINNDMTYLRRNASE